MMHCKIKTPAASSSLHSQQLAKTRWHQWRNDELQHTCLQKKSMFWFNLVAALNISRRRFRVVILWTNSVHGWFHSQPDQLLVSVCFVFLLQQRLLICSGSGMPHLDSYVWKLSHCRLIVATVMQGQSIRRKYWGDCTAISWNAGAFGWENAYNGWGTGSKYINSIDSDLSRWRFLSSRKRETAVAYPLFR